MELVGAREAACVPSVALSVGVCLLNFIGSVVKVPTISQL